MKKSNLEKYLYQLRRIEEHRCADSEKAIRRIYKKILKELKSFLADAYTSYSTDDTLTYASLAAVGMDARFLEEVEQRLNGITPAVASEINSTVAATYEACYNGMREAVVKAAGDRAALIQAFGTVAAVTPDIIRQAVNNPIAGLTLKDTLEKHRKDIIYDIKKNIGVGLSNGDRFTTMAKRISESLDGDYKKAIRIVRTEAHRCRESGYNDAATDLNNALKNGNAGYIMAKTWQTMQDERVRPGKAKGKAKKYNHQKMDGVTIPQDELFELPSGATCMCPSQTGVAGEDINCRCYLSYDLVPASDITQKAPAENYKNVNEAYNKVNLSGIDDEFREEIENELLMLANNYPINTQEIVIKSNKTTKEFGHAASGIRGSKRQDGYYAVKDVHISYSKDLHRTSEISQKYHEATYLRRESKLAASTNAYKATIAHEYAHQIDNWYLFKKKPELYALMQEYSKAKKVGVADIKAINELNKSIHSNSASLSRVVFVRMAQELNVKESAMYGMIMDNYGHYAASSASEFLAEAFTNMLNIATKEKTHFMKVFEKVFNEEFDKVLR